MSQRMKSKGKGGQVEPVSEEAEHPLKKWRRENRYSRPAFLKLLEEQEGVKVSLRSLVYWEDQAHKPRPRVISAIVRVTQGEVWAGDFLTTSNSQGEPR